MVLCRSPLIMDVLGRGFAFLTRGRSNKWQEVMAIVVVGRDLLNSRELWLLLAGMCLTVDSQLSAGSYRLAVVEQMKACLAPPVNGFSTHHRSSLLTLRDMVPDQDQSKITIKGKKTRQDHPRLVFCGLLWSWTSLQS